MVVYPAQMICSSRHTKVVRLSAKSREAVASSVDFLTLSGHQLTRSGLTSLSFQPGQPVEAVVSGSWTLGDCCIFQTMYYTPLQLSGARCRNFDKNVSKSCLAKLGIYCFPLFSIVFCCFLMFSIVSSADV